MSNNQALDAAIYEKYIRPIQRPRQLYAGVEFELPIVNLKQMPVDFNVVYALTDAFIENFDFDVAHYDDDGHIYSAEKKTNGDGLSYDCSFNTLEFSFGIEKDLNVIYQRFTDYYTFIQGFLTGRHHTLTGMGVNPYHEYNNNVPVANGRYRMLLHHLQSYPKYGDAILFHHQPNFGLFCAASQVQLDAQEDTVIDTLNVFAKLEPLKALLFANSPYGDLLCSRDHFWKHSLHGLNPHNVDTYADSIQGYVDNGLLRSPTELYYPIRPKPRGKNVLSVLREQGVDHIELRMFDLNPLVSCGVEEMDVAFAQLLLVWLAATPRQPFSDKDQVQAVQNFKNAAHFDLKTVKIVVPSGEVYSVVEAALKVLGMMRAFYRDFPENVQKVLDFQTEKFLDGENRYAWKVRKAFSGGYVKKGLDLAKKRQEELHV